MTLPSSSENRTKRASSIPLDSALVTGRHPFTQWGVLPETDAVASLGHPADLADGPSRLFSSGSAIFEKSESNLQSALG